MSISDKYPDEHPNTNQAPNGRYERKFVGTDGELYDVLQRIRMSEFGLREAFPPRTVNNIYFDTPDLENLRANIEGFSPRVKYRVRWYGELFGEIRRPAFEIKSRKGSVISKSIARIGPFATSPRMELMPKIQEMIAPYIRQFVGHPVPTLLNSYRRRYYETRAHGIRVTIDTRVIFSSLLHIGSLPCLRPVGPNWQIIEIKYPEEASASAAELTQHLSWRMSRMSKYVEGMRLTHFEA